MPVRAAAPALCRHTDLLVRRGTCPSHETTVTRPPPQLRRYFGAAKNLPGVKELFEREAPRVLRRSRYALHKAIDADYYGFRDEDDGVLLRVEAAAERNIKKRVRCRLRRAPATAVRLPLHIFVRC